MSRRLLVVDDEEAIREIVAISLEAVGGYEVITARSGEEALVRASTDRPDAILLDVMMPGLDGPTTLSRLQALPETRDIDVVLLTAKAQVTERAQLAQLPGVAGVIAKPFDPMTLPDQVSKILGWADPRA